MNTLQEAEVELITYYVRFITENMICAGLETGAADTGQVVLLGHFHSLQIYRETWLLLLCVSLWQWRPPAVLWRGRGDVLFYGSDKLREGVWTSSQARGFTLEQAGLQAGWRQDRQHKTDLRSAYFCPDAALTHPARLLETNITAALDCLIWF